MKKALFSLEAKIIKLIKEKIQYDININQIDYIKRVGQANEEKVRPVLICFLALRVKNIILKNKSKLKVRPQYITEEIPRNILLIRKNLIPKLIKERNEGKFAILRYDQLIIKDKVMHSNDKSKRESKKDPWKIHLQQTLIRKNLIHVQIYF